MTTALQDTAPTFADHSSSPAKPELLHACKWALDSMRAASALTKEAAVKTKLAPPIYMRTSIAKAEHAHAKPDLLAVCKWALDSILAASALTTEAAVRIKLASPIYHLRASIAKAEHADAQRQTPLP